MKSGSHHGETLWSHIKSATPLILIISGATFLMHQFGWLEPLETSALDFMLRLNKPVKPQYVRVVAIDDKDYESLFRKQSPLNPEKVRRLIETIVSLKPRVIGVDIDTTDSRGVRPQDPTRIPVIWGQRPSRIGNVMVPLPVWGGELPQPSMESVGIFVLPADSDQVIRRYARKIPTQHYEEDSLPWAVTKAFCFEVFKDREAPTKLVKKCEDLLSSEATELYNRPRLLSFFDPQHREDHLYRASQVLEKAAAEIWKDNQSPFYNDIVLIGGTFELSGDLHATPLGEMSGIQLIAQAIETELQSKLVTPFEETLMVALELAGAYLLVIWHFFSRGWKSFGLRLLAVPMLAFAFSYFTFSSLAFWASFVPVLVSVLIHELYEHFKYHRELVKAAGARAASAGSQPV